MLTDIDSGFTQKFWLICYISNGKLNLKKEFAFLGGVKSLKSIVIDNETNQHLSLIELNAHKQMTQVLQQLQML
jgi:hypothetical protein